MRRDDNPQCGARRKGFAAMVAGAMLLSVPSALSAAEGGVQQLTVHLGDYRFQPDAIEVVAGRPVELTLVNDDKITPHSFTLKEPVAGLDLDTSVSGGHSAALRFTPRTAGTYIFFCNKKLPFMKSHREHGMEGTLIVQPAS